MSWDPRPFLGGIASRLGFTLGQIPTVRDGGRDLQSLWVGGLAFLLMWLGKKLLPLEGEAFEWAEYLLLGSLFPALVLALCGRGPQEARPRWLGSFMQGLRLALALFCVAYPLWCCHWFRQVPLVVIAGGQWLICLAYLPVSSTFGRGTRLAKQVSLGLVSLALIALSWAVAPRLLWWMPWWEWVGQSPYTMVVFPLSFALVLLNMLHLGEASPPPRAPRRWIGVLLALVVLALARMSFGFPGMWADWDDTVPNLPEEPLIGVEVHQHWGVYVGPAALVRQGGWLLWDVPSQYGFLSILTVAAVPVANVWQALYLVNGLLIFLSAAFLFLVLRSLRPGLLNYGFALLVTLAAALLLPGNAAQLTGPMVYPSMGPLRFFWCYALLAILWWEYRTERGSRDQRRALWLGCGAWLAGALWSSESLVYCCVIWIPAFVVIVLQRVAVGRTIGSGIRAAALPFFSWCLLPVGLLLTTLGFLTAYYRLRLGHGPDWRAFFDYALAWTGGFLNGEIDPDGAVWILVFAFCLISTAIAIVVRHGLLVRPLPLLAGAWAALWATSSYFVVQSHPTLASTLTPLFCVGLGLVLYLLGQRRWAARPFFLIRMGLVPVFTVVLTASFGNQAGVRHQMAALQEGYIRHLAQRLPVLPASPVSLLEGAHVRPEDPILFFDWTQGLLPLRPGEDAAGSTLAGAPRTWLPVAPAILLLPLPTDRQACYLSRFAERVHQGGWLLESRATSLPPYLEEGLQAYTTVKEFENADWRLRWFEPKGKAKP
jgi:hypothetical protein